MPMKRTSTLIIVFLAFSAVAIVSCKEKPIACINYDTNNILDSIKVGQSVRFTSCSENDDRREWNMGDGGPKFTYPFIDYVYDTPGTYTVTLNVWNQNDKYSDEIQRSIIVYP